MDDSEGDSMMPLFLAVFFGWCGLDRLYKGAFFTGFLKMITFGGFGIWWLLDIATLLLGQGHWFLL